MAKGILIFLVVLLFIAGIGLVSYTLLSSVRFLPRLSNSTEHMGQFHSAQMVHITDIYYYRGINETYTCDTLVSEKIVIMEISYDPGNIPDYCEIMIDDRLVKRVRMYDVLCRNCDEVDLSVDMPKQDFSDKHTIRICCQGMCTEKSLDPLC